MRKKQKIITLYEDKSIHAIKQIVSITDEEDLNQLWEYIAMKHSRDGDERYASFVSLYELASRFLDTHPDEFFEIIMEQSEKYYYYTVWNKVFIRFARKQWKKRRLEYRFNEKRITLRLSKQRLQSKSLQKAALDNERISRLLGTVQEGIATSEISPYDFLEKGDLNELLELCDDMSAYLYEAQQAGFSSLVLIKLRSYFSMISIILAHYEELEQMATLTVEFSMILNQYKEALSELNEDQIRVIEGFAHNLERWVRVLFIQGGADLHFMDRSLRADMEMVRMMIEPQGEVGEEELDAIFDF